MTDGILRHTPTLDGNGAIRLLITDVALLPFVGEQLALLTEENSWLEVGDSIADVTAAIWETITLYYNEMLIGMVNQFLGDIPSGWLLLDGTIHPKNNYPELHAVLPDDLKTPGNFTLPDMTGVFSVGAVTKAASGVTGGQNSYALTVGQLPAHTHTYTPPVVNIDLEAPGVPDILAAGIGAPTATGSTGSGDSVDNRPEFVTFQYAIYAGRA